MIDKDDLKKRGEFMTWVYIKVGGHSTTVGEIWRIRHISKPDEQYVIDYRSNTVKRIGDY